MKAVVPAERTRRPGVALPAAFHLLKKRGRCQGPMEVGMLSAPLMLGALAGISEGDNVEILKMLVAHLDCVGGQGVEAQIGATVVPMVAASGMVLASHVVQGSTAN
ncbi:hypothetical protein NDU88_004335 [Pleurodeles waltl]|uniref:Uncharacterized protein n=1 Tax=Pleurodeles waltl TaxID=8319 RepID=A0AAV7LJH4_PLEWA|nr:hypothetical protein NDU88_004335 [Pleurodeles waltl]